MKGTFTLSDVRQAFKTTTKETFKNVGPNKMEDIKTIKNTTVKYLRGLKKESFSKTDLVLGLEKAGSEFANCQFANDVGTGVLQNIDN